VRLWAARLKREVQIKDRALFDRRCKIRELNSQITELTSRLAHLKRSCDRPETVIVSQESFDCLDPSHQANGASESGGGCAALALNFLDGSRIYLHTFVAHGDSSQSSDAGTSDGPSIGGDAGSAGGGSSTGATPSVNNERRWV
jgi:hypothetical protein